MKKWLGIFCLFIFTAPYAGAWGLLIEAAYTDNWFMRKLGHAQITQPVCVRTYADGEFLPGLPADTPVSQEQLVAEMEKALNYWLEKPRAFLQQKGRSEEFADFLAALPQHITLQLQDTCQAEDILQLTYAPREWYINVQHENGRVASVSHKARYTLPRLRTTSEKAWTQTAVDGKSANIHLYERLDLVNLPQLLTHEAGHLIGLADQYGFASYVRPGESTHSYFSYLHVAGENTAALNQTISTRQPASLMGNPRYHAQALQTMWPDDVDGLINAVDMAQIYHRNLLSPRVVNGWKSFSLADHKVGYALALPFVYTPQNTVPQELLARATEYTHGKVGGLEVADFALLHNWYHNTNPVAAYQPVDADELHHNPLAQQMVQVVPLQVAAPKQEIVSHQVAQQVRQELTQALSLTAFDKSLAAKISAPQVTPQLPDLIHLRVPDIHGQPGTLPVVRNPSDEDPDCNFYLIITDKELTWFEAEYGKTLSRARAKEQAGQKLTNKETRLVKWAAQMQENKRKTDKCQAAPAF